MKIIDSKNATGPYKITVVLLKHRLRLQPYYVETTNFVRLSKLRHVKPCQTSGCLELPDIVSFGVRLV